MMYDKNLGIVLEGNYVVASVDGKNPPVGCAYDADKTYFIESRGRKTRLRAKGDEALLLFLVSRFKLETLQHAKVYEKKVEIRPLTLFQGEAAV